jgi:uncharacterized protein YuzE
VKATYDPEADALMIHFFDPPARGYAEDVGNGQACFVGIDDSDRRVSVELLWATENFGLLDDAADQYDLDAQALKAAAAAAMAAPLRFVTVDVGALMFA